MELETKVKEGKQEIVPETKSMTAKLWFETKMNNFKAYLSENLPKNSAIRNQFEKVSGLPTEVIITSFGPELMKYKNGNLDILLDIIAEQNSEDIKKLKKAKPEVLETVKKYLRLIIDFIGEM